MTKKNTGPRQHHYVTAGYLAGFTDTGTREGMLSVLDTKTGRWWEAKPDKAAKERDFNAVNISGHDTNVIESGLSDLEGKAVLLIQELSTAPRLPTTSELEILANFIALQAVRVPAHRTPVARFVEEVGKDVLRISTHTPERFELMKQRLRDAGDNVPDSSFEDWRQYVEREDVVKANQTWLVRSMLKLMDTVLKTLEHRHWHLHVVRPGAPDLVCSDNPVRVTRLRGLPGSPGGFMEPHTIVTMPLTKRLMVAATFDGPGDVTEAGEKQVAAFNIVTVNGAQRQVYAPAREMYGFKKSQP
jgi:hypothetical protein